MPKRNPVDPEPGEPGTRVHVEDMLDEALMQTFPASDPVTLKSCTGEKDASAGSDPVPRGTGPNEGRPADDPPEVARDGRRRRRRQSPMPPR